MTEEIKDLLENLSQKERDVIILLFGLDGFPKSPIPCLPFNEATGNKTPKSFLIINIL